VVATTVTISEDGLIRREVKHIAINTRDLVLTLVNYVRHSSYWSGSLQDGLGDERTCGTTLASAYVLHCLSAAWSQLQMMGRSQRWK